MPMPRIVVVNSTPIIALAEIGQLDIFKQVYGEIVIPVAVHDEVTIKDTQLLAGCDWILVKPISNHTAREMFTSALHDGEVETMLLAKEISADLVIIDDGLARKHAKYLGLNLTGTVGVLLRAKSLGIISDVAPILDSLIKNGFYISDSVCREVLRLVDE
jgi:predicted nucleic acid-binding protein